jgi:hypothetical protein
MQESYPKIDIPEDIENLAKMSVYTNAVKDNEIHIYGEWLFQDRYMLASVISSYLANLGSPEACLKAFKTPLWGLVKDAYTINVSKLNDEEDKAHFMQLIS